MQPTAAEADSAPLLLVLEDAHWVDPTTIELLTVLAQASTAGNIMILVTARPEFEPTELPFEDLERHCVLFDTVFSMGILYHRKKQSEHLAELLRLLKPGGELVLETLVLEGDDKEVLIPEKTYAKMPNVSAVPTVSKLMGQVENAGFENARVVDVTKTTAEEQRKTPWMTFESLSDYLDPNNSSRTIEGYPAPVRAVVVASRPVNIR